MNYDFVKQESWSDCGVACLAMLIDNFQHQKISLYELKEHLNSVQNQELSFFDLIQIGEKYGLKGEGFHCELEMLEANAHRCPLILNVSNQYGASHYVVLQKVEKNYFFINDPSQERQLIKLSFEELKVIFFNKILIFWRTQKLKCNFNFLVLFTWTLTDWPLILGAILAVVLANLFWILSSSFISEFAVWVSLKKINWGVFLEFVFYLFGACCAEYLDRFLHFQWRQKLFNRLSEILFCKQNNVQVKRTQELEHQLELLQKTIEILQLFWSFLLQTFISCLFLPVIFWKLQPFGWMFLLLPLIILLFTAAFKIILLPKFYNLQKKQQNTQNKYANVLKNYLTFRKTIEAKALSQKFGHLLVEQQKKKALVDKQVERRTLIFAFWDQFCTRFFYFLVLILVFFRFRDKEFGYSHLIFLTVLSNLYLSLILKTTKLWIVCFLKRREFSILDWLTKIQDFELNTQTVLQVSFKNLLLFTKTSKLELTRTFENSFSVEGDLQLVQKFFHAFLDLNPKIFVNAKKIGDFQDLFFYLDSQSQLFPGTIFDNLFFFNQNLDQEIYQEANVLKWLEKYKIDFQKQKALSTCQTQLVNFLSAFFSDSHFYLFNNCCSQLSSEDQRTLIELFFKLKPNVFVIFYSEKNRALKTNCKENLVLDTMI